MTLMPPSDSMLLALLVREAEAKGAGQLGQLSQADTARAQRLYQEMKTPGSAIHRMAETAAQINRERLVPSLDAPARAVLARETKAQALACTLRKIERAERIAGLKATKFQNLDGLVSDVEMQEALRIAKGLGDNIGPVWAQARQRLGPVADVILQEARTLLDTNKQIQELELEQANDLDPDEQEAAAFAEKERDTQAMIAANQRRAQAFEELQKLEEAAKADKARAARIETLRKELAQ